MEIKGEFGGPACIICIGETLGVCRADFGVSPPPLTVHGVQRFEGDDFGDPGGAAPQKLLQVVGVVVTEDEFGDPAAPDALNHGGVVPRVRVHLAACGTPKHGGTPK